MIIAGYIVLGLLTILLALSGNLGVVLALAVRHRHREHGLRHPEPDAVPGADAAELMGRVVGFRFALVFGSMTLAMALGGVLAEVDRRRRR